VRALTLSACLAAAVGCHSAGNERMGVGGHGGGAPRPDAGTTPIPVPGDDGGTAAPSVPNRDPPGPGGPAACPPSAAPVQDAGATPAPVDWGAPTAVPFSCDPLPGAFFFAQPGADTTGLYARCASFAEAQATAVALNTDGTRAALIGTDRIARIVDVASHTVVGVLAPPRAGVDLAAFSPAGDTILTVSKGERLATLWRTDTFAPVWTTGLPGHTYYNSWQGAAVFSPDGAKAAVSPGSSLYLLDVGTGTLLTTRTSDAVLGAAYGWNGRRLVVEESGVFGMCAPTLANGSVTILDPSTLAPIATPISWPLMSDEGPPPGQMVVAANADLLVTSGPLGYPWPVAFQVSDGSVLPSPYIDTMPLAVTPDGTAGAILAGGQLVLQQLSDGGVLATAPVASASATAMSADGTTFALGAKGASLLGVWQPATNTWAAVCSAEARPSGATYRGPLLSADGQTVTVNWATQLRILHRTDGAPIATIDGAGQPIGEVTQSADGAYAIVNVPGTTAGTTRTLVYGTADGTQVADLTKKALPCAGINLFFTPSDAVEGLCSAATASALLTPLPDGGWQAQSSFSQPVTTAGFSDRCLVMVASRKDTAWRACGGCSSPPFTTSTTGGVLSQDGTAFLGQDPGNSNLGSTLWNVFATSDAVRKYPARPEEASFGASEVPVAISTHGDRVITTAQKLFVSCGNWPAFTSRVHDVATDQILDELPPAVTSSSADLGVVAIGPVLWCAR
jgi:hypothetical protein